MKEEKQQPDGTLPPTLIQIIPHTAAVHPGTEEGKQCTMLSCVATSLFSPVSAFYFILRDLETYPQDALLGAHKIGDKSAGLDAIVRMDRSYMGRLSL